MKKIIAALLAVMLILSCVGLGACDFFRSLIDDDNEDGNDYIPDVSDHEHEFDSYFQYTQCKVDGCSVVGRLDSEDKYAKDFKYTLTTAKINEISSLYQDLLACLDSGDDYEQFEALYDEYLDLLDYVGHQYQVSSVLSDVTYNATTVKNYSTASKLYNEMFANYYDLYERIYNSNFCDSFYDGWSESEIQEARYYAEIYGGSADNNNEVDDIINEYEEYMDSIGWHVRTTAQLNTISEIYGRLVVANNNVATSAHYDNYMYYAYENNYNRDYTPDDVATMREYVKQYVAPIFTKVAYRYHTLVAHGSNFNSDADEAFYYGLMEDSLFTAKSSSDFGEVKTTIDYISEYFQYINRSQSITGGKEVNFYNAVDDLFKNGNYFRGEYSGAYTWWIDAIDTPIVYFGDAYDTAFTFVHEFGHYYENIYNGSMHLSYDHDETHSQGNEMLFLAWLSQHKPAGVTNGFDVVEIAQLFDMFASIILSTAVDEFEQAAYTGYYNGEKISGSYATLFTTILHSYDGADNWLNDAYWSYVVFDNAAYYISYAMSALPSIELYAKAKSKGLYEARDSYVKLFTFANDSKFVTIDSNGRKRLTDDATYESILNYCGLQGPFQIGLYTSLQSYFNTRTDFN